MAQNFALAIHELATNAAKYGALSAPDGRLDVSWTLGNEALILQWTESGGPPSHAAQEDRLRLEGHRCQHQAAAQRRHRPGLVGRRPALRRARAGGTFFAAAAHVSVRVTAATDDHLAAKPSAIRGRRVLLVEDEPLVAMMMSQMIRELGGEVAGPFGTLDEASGASLEAVDAAVLDVNVAGELVYPLADRLIAHDKPIVFLTGYDANSVDSRFRGSPVLTKPIDERELVSVLAGLFDGATAESALAG